MSLTWKLNISWRFLNFLVPRIFPKLSLEKNRQEKKSIRYKIHENVDPYKLLKQTSQKSDPQFDAPFPYIKMKVSSI